MFAYRQRGLVTLHAAIITGIITTALPVYSIILPFMPRIRLYEGVELLPYCLAVFLAMTASTGIIRKQGGSLHILGISGSMALAAQQVLYISAALFSIVFSLKDQSISRLFLGSYLVITFIILSILHAKLPSTLAKMLFPERNHLPTILIGCAQSLEDLDTWISSRGHIGIRPIGFIADTEPTRCDKAVAPYLGKVSDLSTIIKERAVAQVILLDWTQRNEVIESIVEACEQEGVRFLIHNNFTARFAREMIAVEEGGRHFLVMQNEPLEDPINRAAKRLVDIIISLPVCLFILPPLCLFVWLIQKKQAPGPLFFNRPRGGLNRKAFNMFKFRSMYDHDHDINKQATTGDIRIYPFGILLRKSSLDEFPQFFNVLQGNMSVVGPRPHLPQHDDEFSRLTRSYHGRAYVKPGITGLAQIRGYRGEVTEPHKLHRRVYWDLYYVSRWSLWLDIRIIFITAWHVIRPPVTAY
jgi:exopolysaccharide biosynthesis polyprenyl glycosylphosphotransferase